MAKGYTKIENDYFLMLSRLDLKASELRVLLFLLRQSACYKRDYTKECSATFIAEGTGISSRQVKRALTILSDKKLIYLDVEHSSKRGHSWYIASDKLGHMKGQTWSIISDTHGTDSRPSMSHKEITEDNSKKKKEKREASPSFFPNFSIDDYSGAEAKAWKDVLSEEDFQKWLGGYVWD